jgi:hypothetical protein
MSVSIGLSAVVLFAVLVQGANCDSFRGASFSQRLCVGSRFLIFFLRTVAAVSCVVHHLHGRYYFIRKPQTLSTGSLIGHKGIVALAVACRSPRFPF